MQTILGVAPDDQLPDVDRRLGQPDRPANVLHSTGRRSTSQLLGCPRVAGHRRIRSARDRARIRPLHRIQLLARRQHRRRARPRRQARHPRVAFGEGFGYAFAAIVLNDPVARDSSSTTAARPGSRAASTSRQSADDPASDRRNYGCWCSESSVWSILWDLYDTRRRRATTPSRWDSSRSGTCSPARRRPRRRSPRIFSFITALKAANTGAAPPPSTRWWPRRTSPAPTWMHSAPPRRTSPTGVPTQRGAAGVHHRDRGRRSGRRAHRRRRRASYNKLGNHRFLRFTLPDSRHRDHHA